MISLGEFLALPTEEVARQARQAGPQVCVFPINGTRRWFMLEHAQEIGEDPVASYLDISSQNHISLYRLFFEHGIDTLLTPTFGPDILLRGDDYMRNIGAEGLARLARGADFMTFYKEYDVRVCFYGDYRKALKSTSYAYLSDLFDEAADQTRQHQRHRLFFGVFANDATESIAELSVHYYQKRGQIPDRRTLVELYYGEYVEPASLFIGFDKFSAYDYPLLATGGEDLYFTVAPSPYMTDRQLRMILYDHLFTRRVKEPDYAILSREDLSFMTDFYKTNQKNVLGVGVLIGGIWYPISKIGRL